MSSSQLPLSTMDESRLRSHLQTTLEELPNNLPPYDEEGLLDDLCSLLRSPLFHYAIKPRLRQSNSVSESSVTGVLTPESLEDEYYHEKARKSDDGMDMSKLNIGIKWNNNTWVTQLLHGEHMLLEGRQVSVEQEMGFVQSFHWFCEEARFLWYEFQARELAAAVHMGTVVEPAEVDSGIEKVKEAPRTRARSEGKKRRRIVKLKIRVRETSGGPVLAARTK